MVNLDLLEICNQACKKAISLGVDETEIYATSSRKIEVTIENNHIHRTVSHQEHGIGIRVFKNKSLGFASVNILDRNKIDEAINTAVSLSKRTPPDEYNGIPEPREIHAVSEIYDLKAEDFGIEDALKLAFRMLRTVKDFDTRVSVESGSFTAEITKKAIINSRGICAEELSSTFTYYIMGMAVEGTTVSTFDFQFDGTRFIDQIDVESLAREFARNVVNSLGATKGESFKGHVLLSPNAVMAFLSPVIFSVQADNVQKGMSKLAGKLGTKIANEILTIEDNGLLPGGLSTSAFDREGIPRSSLFIIKNGILNSYLYNTYTAKKAMRTSTGHAGGGPRSLPAISPSNVIIKEGDKGKDEIIRNIKKGVLVTRFSGFPNPISGDFSGVVKGGYLIKDGQIVKPLIETLIAGNVFELLHRISAISRERKKIFNFLLPYISMDEVSITSG